MLLVFLWSTNLETSVDQQEFSLPVSWPQLQYFPESKVDPTSGVPSTNSDPQKFLRVKTSL